MSNLNTLHQRFAEILDSVIAQWPIDPEDKERAQSRAASEGAVNLVRSAIRADGPSEEAIVLCGRNRFDLTLEAIALAPTWHEIFSLDDRAKARERLAVLHAKREKLHPYPAATFDDAWIAWIDGRPIGTARYSGSRAASPCDAYEERVGAYAETGQFQADFYERRHYWNCKRCSTLTSLHEVVAWLDNEEFRRLKALLELMPKGNLGPLGIMELFVLCGFIDLSFDIEPEDWVSARQGKADSDFSDFVQSLDSFEYFGFPLAKTVHRVFSPVFPQHGELLLPADVPSVPGVFNTAISVEQWTRLQEEEDEAFWGQKPGTGCLDDQRFDTYLFWHLAIEATSFQILNWWKGELNAADVLTPFYLPGLPEPHRDEGQIKAAEASLRDALGTEIFDSLHRYSLSDATAAERQYLDPDLEQGHGLVYHLANAFQYQLMEVVFRPFAQALKDTGVRELPWPLSEAIDQVSRLKLEFGKIKKCMEHCPPELMVFLREKGLPYESLADAVKDVHYHRNRTSHLEPYTAQQGRQIRDRWLGIEEADGGIFGRLYSR